MKFNTISLLNSLLLLLFASQPALSREEDVIDGIKVARYPISDVVKEMQAPSDRSASGIEIPAHMQYIVGLDQPGNVVKGTGISVVDPEYAITLSAGDFSLKNDVLEQSLNRCYGGFWTFFDNEKGKEFLTVINGAGDGCNLTFRWNEDKTVGKILGYMETRVFDIAQKVYWFLPKSWIKGGSDATGFFADKFSDFTIELQPYWKWKFGITSDKPDETTDEKCCPAKNASKSCFGPGKLGKSDECETLSMACGEVKKEDLAACAMYKRRNKVADKEIQIPFFRFSSYLVYPLFDKYGVATPYNQFYSDAMKSNGIKNLFHGVAPAQKTDEL